MNTTEDIVVGFAAGAVILAGVAAVVAASVLMNGYLLHTMWGWFAVPLGLPAIGIAHAIGVSATINVAVGSRVKRDKDDKSLGAVMTEVFVIRPLAILACGYIAHAYMVAP